jgi:glutamate/tyrosine decarboxylase-like PLP-dependent enzyme
MAWSAIEAELDALQARDPDRRRGRLTMFGMQGTDEVQRVAEQAFQKFFKHNALFGPRLPSVWQMEEDLKAWSLDLLGGGTEGRASITTGGSESIFCAMHAAREWAREHKPGIVRPEVVVPYSAHAAFSKACHYLGMTLRRVPLGPDYRAGVEALAAAIGPDTIALAGSAPAWPHGMIDPIERIADLARAHGLWMHVDACVGGFFIPFARMAGEQLPDMDLRVPGVCSLSADLHKYGYAPKPISAVLYASEVLHAYQPHVVEDWPTGPYRTEGVVGSRAGGAIAGAWAVMKFLGAEGYTRLTRRTLEVKEQLIAGLDEIPGLRAWRTDASLLVWGADTLDVQAIAAGLRERGWFVMGTLDPPLIHLNLDPVDDDWIEMYLADVAAVVETIASGARAQGELHYAQ